MNFKDTCFIQNCINSRFVSLFSYQSSLRCCPQQQLVYIITMLCFCQQLFYLFFLIFFEKSRAVTLSNQLVNSIICIDFCQALFTIFYCCFSEAFRSRDSLFIISNSPFGVNNFLQTFTRFFSKLQHPLL